MRILLTNDDGVDAPLLAELATQLDALGDVDVIAPATRHDGRLALAQPRAARSPSTRSACRTAAPPSRSAGRRPTACASARSASPARRPTSSISGPNRGVNLGDDVAYSGTVAAALEGALLGMPAAALSQQARPGRRLHG